MASLPPCVWAQRADKVYFTVNLDDAVDPEIKFEETKVLFKSKNKDGKVFELEFELNEPINVDESRFQVFPRNIPMVLIKKEEKWWPRLTKASGKVHWLKTDFDKWRDEDDDDMGDEDPMAGMGGMGGMPGMGGMGGMPGMGGMGGMPGMGGPGGMDFSSMMQNMGGMDGGPGGMDFGDDAEEDSDDEDAADAVPTLNDKKEANGDAPTSNGAGEPDATASEVTA